jgi:flagellar biosynthesis protein FlhF
MHIKKFVGRTLKEAAEQMKAELGPEAIILNSRTVARGGAFSLLGKEMFEVTAALDEPAAAPARSGYRRPGAGGSAFDRYADAARQTSEEDAQPGDPVEDLRRVAQRFEQRARGDRQPERTRDAAEWTELRSELREVKGTLRDIADQMKYAKMPPLPESLRRAYQTMVERDIDPDLAADLVQTVLAHLTPDQLRSGQSAEAAVVAAMAAMLHPAGDARSRRKKGLVIALVGPTGVGKTTTIAKLAAIQKLVNHLDVGLISADTYRIGAIEQLRTFAAIADIPMEVVYKPSEVAPAIRKFRHKDLILMDTVGRSQRSTKELQALSKFVQAADPDEIHLVLSASTGVKTAESILKHFAALKPNRLLFSKLDEAATLGPLLTVASRHQLPLSYVTTGQNVPDDILPVDPSRMAGMIYSGVVAHA